MKTEPKSLNQLHIDYVHKFAPSMPDDEALKAYAIFRAYVDEGQNHSVARMYAGFASSYDIGEY